MSFINGLTVNFGENLRLFRPKNAQVLLFLIPAHNVTSCPLGLLVFVSKLCSAQLHSWSQGPTCCLGNHLYNVLKCRPVAVAGAANREFRNTGFYHRAAYIYSFEITILNIWTWTGRKYSFTYITTTYIVCIGPFKGKVS